MYFICCVCGVVVGVLAVAAGCGLDMPEALVGGLTLDAGVASGDGDGGGDGGGGCGGGDTGVGAV